MPASLPLADYFESAAAHCSDYKLLSNWIMTEVLRILKEQKIEIGDFPVSPQRLAELLGLIGDHTISAKIAKAVFEEMLTVPENPRAIIEKKGLAQISDSAMLETMIDQIIADNPAQVTQYREGKTKVFSFFVGQVMKATRGQANPQVVTEILQRKLAGG